MSSEPHKQLNAMNDMLDSTIESNMTDDEVMDIDTETRARLVSITSDTSESLIGEQGQISLLSHAVDCIHISKLIAWLNYSRCYHERWIRFEAYVKVMKIYIRLHFTESDLKQDCLDEFKKKLIIYLRTRSNSSTVLNFEDSGYTKLLDLFNISFRVAFKRVDHEHDILGYSPARLLELCRRVGRYDDGSVRKLTKEDQELMKQNLYHQIDQEDLSMTIRIANNLRTAIELYNETIQEI